MKYYLLEQDKRYTHLPQMINWNKVIDERDVHMGRYSKLPEKSMIYVKHDKEIFFPDILLFPFLMVNNKVKEKLQMYEPNMAFRILFLVDRVSSNYEYYSIPFIKEVDCMSSKSELNRDRSVINKLVLDGSKIPEGKPLFMLKGVNSRYVVARMDFVESILKQDIYGLKLTEIEVDDET